jgi:NADPH:quinone reductase-like Zn-dependent oxidoreductase
MRVFEVRRGGSSLEDLIPAERPKPVPGAGQVLVRMRAASLNYRDLAIVTGHYFSGPVPHNTIPLSDGAGEVESIGAGVTGFSEGDRVVATFTQGGVMQALGSPLDGVLTEYALFDPSGLLKIPDSLTFEEAATLPCAGVTAWNALTEGKRLRPGETVLALGTGGVSIMALQLSKVAGARVIITSSSDAKLEKAQALGADDTINYRTHPNWDEQVMDLTGGDGADQIVEVGGAGTLPHSYLSIANGGEIALIGVLTPPDGNLAPHALMVRSATLRGIFVGPTPLFVGLLRAVEQNQIRPIIDSVFDFDDAPRAYQHLQSAQHFGKVVIKIG